MVNEFWLLNKLPKDTELIQRQSQKNFNNNKSRFCEGKHFFLLKGADLKDFKSNIQNLDTVGKFANQLYLWTEKGAYEQYLHELN